jgi:hypothetical protein
MALVQLPVNNVQLAAQLALAGQVQGPVNLPLRIGVGGQLGVEQKLHFPGRGIGRLWQAQQVLLNALQAF